jgi:L-rhamnose-H+ transport protein
MSFAFIGLSLAYALNYGAQIVFGSMLPLLIFDANQVLTVHGGVILLGVGVCLAGVVVSGRAAMLKQRSLDRQATDAAPADLGRHQPKMLVGVLIGVMSGILCACYAVASAFAAPIGTLAAADNPPWAAAVAVTAVILWGGAVSSCLYCVAQLTRNKTWGGLVGPGAGRVLLLAALMALLHNAAIFLFGLGWIHIGDLGVSVGYPVFMSVAIIVGNVHGFRTGEWRGAGRESVAWIIAGIALLILGVCLLAQGRAMLP